MQTPTCCGKKMEKRIETSRYTELECQKCGDVVYLRKPDVQLPQMLDD